MAKNTDVKPMFLAKTLILKGIERINIMREIFLFF